MKIAVVKETCPRESRVALVPQFVPELTKAGFEVTVEAEAGLAAGFRDDDYREKGATIVETRDAAFLADIVLQVRAGGANPGTDDRSRLRAGQVAIGMCDPLGSPEAVASLADTDAALFALELIPRTTRAQSMDVLSSMATLAGYRAVILAAAQLPKMFPLMMTAAGTLQPARVFVIGGGVAGLQAIATARRLGAVVYAYDVRPAVKEQVESLGGRFVELPVEPGESEDQGGYAKEMDEAFYQRQRDCMAKVAAESDVVVCTAAIPGKTSPLLLTAAAVEGMPAGSVVVDLAAERGGNCELSEPEQTVTEHGVTILGPTNLAAEVPHHASQMYARNMVNFLRHMTTEGQLVLDLEDPIIRDTLVAHEGHVVHPRLRDILQLEPLDLPSNVAGGDEGHQHVETAADHAGAAGEPNAADSASAEREEE